MIDHKFPVVIAVCTILLASLALSMLVFIGFTTKVWDIGLMGLYITSLALAVGVLVAAESIRAGTKQYKKLSKKIEANARKLDTIASQQEQLIAILTNSSLHCPAEVPSPVSAPSSTESSDDPGDSP